MEGSVRLGETRGGGRRRERVRDFGCAAVRAFGTGEELILVSVHFGVFSVNAKFLQKIFCDGILLI